MKKIIPFVLSISLLFSACNSESGDSSGITQNYITINGEKHSIFETGFPVSFGGGNYTSTQNGEVATKVFRLKIEDPNNIFTSLLANENLTNTLIFRFIYDADVEEGDRTTIDNISLMTENTVIAEYFSPEMPSTYALSNQNIFIKITDDKIEVKFSNVTYGTDIIDGHFKTDY
ncbi:hypothetical protein [Flavobacterium sp.]|jgi:hypothetical protein|uniref:hypothetical protein n=1 Tax=Flavobacterium sp. TaxID=239 RepID=UPI0037C0570E